MSSKVLPLALAAGAVLSAYSASAREPSVIEVQTQSTNLTQTCAFTNGPRAGETVDYTGDPGAPAIPVGSRCADMQGSSGDAVVQPPSPPRPPSRFYVSPGAPGVWGSAGEPSPGYTLTCLFDRGPDAGYAQDFSGVLGSEPIPIGAACTNGVSTGRAVSPGEGAQLPR
jgi:hypothetical protein